MTEHIEDLFDKFQVIYRNAVENELLEREVRRLWPESPLITGSVKMYEEADVLRDEIIDWAKIEDPNFDFEGTDDMDDALVPVPYWLCERLESVCTEWLTQMEGWEGGTLVEDKKSARLLEDLMSKAYLAYWEDKKNGGHETRTG